MLKNPDQLYKGLQKRTPDESPSPATSDDSDDPVAPPTRVPLQRPVVRAPAPASEPSDRDIVEVATGDSPHAMTQEMEEQIAQLQAALQEKEQTLLEKTISATSLKRELDQAKTRNEHLRKKLTTVVRAHESLSQKVVAGGQTAPADGRQITETEVAEMKEQWRVAQKSFEREYTRARTELAKAKAEVRDASQELEAQTRARRAEAAQASLRIANLERDIEGVKSAPPDENPQARVLSKLAYTAAATAVVMLILGFWWQTGHASAADEGARRQAASGVQASGGPALGKPSTARPSTPFSASSSASLPGPAGSAKSSFSGSGSDDSGGGFSGGLGSALGDGGSSQGSFQRALNRLNNLLYGPVGVTPEQILKVVRVQNAKTNPNVCTFEWNNGQPTLYYGGSQKSLESSIDQCSSAVEAFLQRPDARIIMSRK